MSVHGPLGATPQSGAFDLSTRALDARTTSSRARLGLVALVGVLVTGLVVSISAARTDSLLPESVRFLSARGAPPEKIARIMRRISPVPLQTPLRPPPAADEARGGVPVKHLFTEGRAAKSNV